MGAKDEHTLKAFLEAEAFDGPSIIIAYSSLHRPWHQHDHVHDRPESRRRVGPVAVISLQPGARGGWRESAGTRFAGTHPQVQEYLLLQTRFKMLTKSKPEVADKLWKQAQQDAERRYQFYEYMASRKTEPASAAKPSGRENCSRCRKTGADRSCAVAARGGPKWLT